MVGSLLNLVNNLSEGIHRIKCKYNHDEKKNNKIKNGKLAKLNISIASVSSNMQTLKKI